MTLDAVTFSHSQVCQWNDRLLGSLWITVYVASVYGEKALCRSTKCSAGTQISTTYGPLSQMFISPRA